MGVKDLAKLGFERDKERNKCATQLVARPAAPHPPMRQAGTRATAAWGAEDWRAYYAERATLREYAGRRPRAFAETLAWGELQSEWRRLHGERAPDWQCAGCLKPASGSPVFTINDGARTHNDLDCIAAYGKRWRGAATAALVAMGLPRPVTVPEDEP